MNVPPTYSEACGEGSNISKNASQEPSSDIVTGPQPMGPYGPDLQRGYDQPYQIGNQPMPGSYGPYITGVTPSGTVITQPQPAVQVVMPNRLPQDKDYLVLSLVTCLCFNFLFGAIALCFSVHSRDLYRSGRREEARHNAKVAFLLNIIGIVFSAILIIVLVILLMVSIMTTS